ncbi:unnamed protein product [Calypogeia fissa]
MHYVYKSDVNEIIMAAFVDCGEKEAAGVIKYYIWMLFSDDRLDNITYACSPEKSRVLCLELNVTVMWSCPDDKHLYNNFLEFLELGEVSERSQTLNYMQSKLDEVRLKPDTVYDTSAPHFQTLNKAFRDLWAELCEIMPADFLRRWALLFQEQILSNLKETRNRKSKIIPSVDEYLAYCSVNVAIQTCAVAVEYVDHVHLPDKVFDCSKMQRLINAITDFIFSHNDLWSFQTEALLGDVREQLGRQWL